MKLLNEHLEKIKDYLSTPRKKPEIEMIDFLNAVLYVIENGCKRRALPKEFGDWHTILRGSTVGARTAHWTRPLQRYKTKILLISAHSSFVLTVHQSRFPDATGALKKHGKQAIGRSKGGLQPRFMSLLRLPNLR